MNRDSFPFHFQLSAEVCGNSSVGVHELPLYLQSYLELIFPFAPISWSRIYIVLKTNAHANNVPAPPRNKKNPQFAELLQASQIETLVKSC